MEKLGRWTLDAKEWRVRNGYTTPEWEMYVENRHVISIVVFVLGMVMGIMLTMLISA